jgi:hypothetical protein
MVMFGIEVDCACLKRMGWLVLHVDTSHAGSAET